MKEATLSIKGTVLSYEIKDDMQIVAFKISKVFHNSKQDIHKDDIITIYIPTYIYTSLADCVEMLQTKGTYYLNLYHSDDNETLLDGYYLLYPFQKQIEETKNHVIIFCESWKSLINNETYTVHFQNEKTKYYGRIDDQFDNDYQKLIEQYMK